MHDSYLSRPPPQFLPVFQHRRHGDQLLSLIRVHYPGITPYKLLRLEFQCEEGMSLVWIMPHTMLYMWGTRVSGKIVNSILNRAALERKISILRETRFANEYILIKEIVEAHL